MRQKQKKSERNWSGKNNGNILTKIGKTEKKNGNSRKKKRNKKWKSHNSLEHDEQRTQLLSIKKSESIQIGIKFNEIQSFSCVLISSNTRRTATPPPSLIIDIRENFLIQFWLWRNQFYLSVLQLRFSDFFFVCD